MATLRLRHRKRDSVVVGELRYYPRPGAPQVSVTIEGELTAQRYRDAVERALADGAPIPPPPGGSRPKVEPEAMTVGDFFMGPFMHRHWPGLAEATQRKYRSCWNVHALHHDYGIAERTLADIDADPNIVGQMKNAMLAAGVGRATINNTLALLGAIFTQATRTPGSGMRHHPMRGGIVRYESVNPEEPPLPHPPMAVAMVAAAMPDDELISAEGSRLYLMLMNGSGVRPGEARAMRTNDIRERTAAVWRAIGAEGELKEIKNTKWHYPPVPSSARAALLEFARGREFLFPMLQSGNASATGPSESFAPRVTTWPPSIATAGRTSGAQPPTTSAATASRLCTCVAAGGRDTADRNSPAGLVTTCARWKSTTRGSLPSTSATPTPSTPLRSWKARGCGSQMR